MTGRVPGGRARPGHPGCDAAGQATVEFALVLPVLMLVILLVFQVVLIGKDQLLVIHAAREAARAASVGADADAAARRVLPGAQVRVSGGASVGAPVAVEVIAVSPTALPLVGPLLPDPTVRARVEMRTEQARR